MNMNLKKMSQKCHEFDKISGIITARYFYSLEVCMNWACFYGASFVVVFFGPAFNFARDWA